MDTEYGLHTYSVNNKNAEPKYGSKIDANHEITIKNLAATMTRKGLRG